MAGSPLVILKECAFLEEYLLHVSLDKATGDDGRGKIQGTNRAVTVSQEILLWVGFSKPFLLSALLSCPTSKWEFLNLLPITALCSISAPKCLI